MFYKSIAVALVVVLLHGSLMAQPQSQVPLQSPAKMQQVLRKAQDKDKAVKATLNNKIDNQTQFTGKVSEISDAGFTLTDPKSGKATKLAYADVVQVKQKGLSKGAKIAIGVGVGVAVVMVVSVAACYGSGLCKD